MSLVSVLEADAVADLAGGPGAGLGQEQPPVGTDAHLVDGLPCPGGRGAGGGLPLRQPHQADPASVQRNLRGREGARQSPWEEEESGLRWFDRWTTAVEPEDVTVIIWIDLHDLIFDPHQWKLNLRAPSCLLPAYFLPPSCLLLLLLLLLLLSAACLHVWNTFSFLWETFKHFLLANPAALIWTDLTWHDWSDLRREILLSAQPGAVSVRTDVRNESGDGGRSSGAGGEEDERRKEDEEWMSKPGGKRE